MVKLVYLTNVAAPSDLTAEVAGIWAAASRGTSR